MLATTTATKDDAPMAHAEDYDPDELVTCRCKDGSTFQVTRRRQQLVYDALMAAEQDRLQRLAAADTGNDGRGRDPHRARQHCNARGVGDAPAGA